MKQVLVAVLIGWWWLGWIPVQTAYAEEGVLNNPPAAISSVKAVINKLNPSYETVWDVYNGGFSQGVSASLYSFTSHQIPIASLRAGFGTGERLYGGVSLDLPGLAKLLPSSIRGPADVSPLDTVWSFVGKYGRVGVVGGYSWDEQDPVIGLTVGAALTF